MKYWIYIIIFLLQSINISAQEVVNEESVESETIVYPTLQNEHHTPTPVILDEQELKSYTSSNEYDYYTFRPKEENFFYQLLNQIARWLSRSSSTTIAKKDSDIIGWALVAVAIILLVVGFFIFRPSLFYRASKKKKLDYQVEEETIHGISFDQLIRNALERDDYSEAIRWKYLSVLKSLQDKGLISWEVHKTVNEYIREFKRPDLKQEFRSLSAEFLYVRFGHFEASQEEYESVKTWSDEIIKRI